MRIAVLGATGFLGLNTVSALLSGGETVVAFCPRSERSRALAERGVEVVDWDILKSRSFDYSLKSVDWLIHLASATSPKESMLDPQKNAADLAASSAAFEEAVGATIKKILFSSSGGTVYGNPRSIPVNETSPANPAIPYAKTKLAIENELLRLTNGTNTVPIILRLGNPYGRHQHPSRGTGVITAWLEAVRDGKPVVIYGDGGSARDFFHVSDAVSAMGSALRNASAKGIYNIGSGIATSLNTILEVIEEVTSRKPAVTRLPHRPSDLVKAIALDSTRARRDFGWHATVGLHEGIRQTWDWVQAGEPLTI